ncbi:hypothetical protein OPV22_031993 [Ensete ventricosum]|uniref:Protein translation factor SUI1 homolog n=1 Tax=Ensete ventricosum TaxID=4639 RepID=A0AAV8PU85_ENSVE|nr:hypothetical protein OPV22_031993 [Ensete ventricosum]
MSDLDVHIPTAFDPFADANAEDSGAGTKEYVHIRVQQRNGRKSLTTVQGLKKEFSYNKILKDLKKEFCCNGTVVQDPELGQVIQLQGDQRKNVSSFLVQAGIMKKEHIKIHGYLFDDDPTTTDVLNASYTLVFPCPSILIRREEVPEKQQESERCWLAWAGQLPSEEEEAFGGKDGGCGS